MKKCPFCAEEIKDDAIKCRYCGERLDTKPTPGDSDEQLKSPEKLSGQDYNQPHEPPKMEPPQDSDIDLGGFRYTPIKESTVKAFCFGCRSVDSMNRLYYCNQSKFYYHKECLIKEGGISAALTEGASLPPVSSSQQSTVATPPIEKPEEDESDKFWGGIYHPWRRFFARTVDISTGNKMKRIVLTLCVFIFVIIIFSFRYESDQIGNRIIRYDRFTSRVEWKSVFSKDDNWRPSRFKSLPQAKAVLQRRAMEEAQEEMADQMREQHEEAMDQMREQQEELERLKSELEWKR